MLHASIRHTRIIWTLAFREASATRARWHSAAFVACSHPLAQPAVILTLIKLDQDSRFRGGKVIS